MKKFFGWKILWAAFVVLGWHCSKDNKSDQGTVIVLDHFGYDFSAGKKDTVRVENNDAHTVGWYPQYPVPENNPYPSFAQYIWMNNEDTLTWKCSQKHLGQVSLQDVKSQVPAQWDTLLMPLLKGHAYIAKCHDGYIKFEVVATDSTEIENYHDYAWPVKIKYVFFK